MTETVHICQDGYPLKFNRTIAMERIRYARKHDLPLYEVKGANSATLELTSNYTEARQLFDKLLEGTFWSWKHGLKRCIQRKAVYTPLKGIEELREVVLALLKKKR